MEKTCVHSCNGLCRALGMAERREEEAIRDYRRFAEQCDYPDVRYMLERLVADKERSLKTLQQTRAVLEARFSTLSAIGDSFA